jgi:hypothetical protein
MQQIFIQHFFFINMYLFLQIMYLINEKKTGVVLNENNKKKLEKR